MGAMSYEAMSYEYEKKKKNEVSDCDDEKGCGDLRFESESESVWFFVFNWQKKCVKICETEEVILCIVEL